MAVCSIAIAAGVIGALALVKGMMWSRRFGGPMALAACGPGGHACGAKGPRFRARWGSPYRD